MNIGLMRCRIVIQKETVTIDSIGNRTNTWTAWHSCFAYVNMQTGGEHESTGRTIVTDTLVFTVRYCSALAGMQPDGYRISFNGRLYNITAVDDFQFRHETLKLTATRTER